MFLLVLFATPQFLFAMKINEIMYDVPGTDSGREWIEVFNDTDTDIDFSNWKLLENAVNHAVKLILGEAVIPKGGFAIIADNTEKFLIDNPDFDGTLFDSVFSLTNTGETLALINPSGNKVDEITYSDSLGAKGDGNSLQMNDGFLMPAIPTPGKQNSREEIVQTDSNTSATTTSDISTHSSSISLSKTKETFDFEVLIGRDRMSSIKSPIIFEAKPKNDIGLGKVKYSWNMGDGNRESGSILKYAYKHPGSYNIVLNATVGGKHSVARLVAHILEPKIDFVLSEKGIEFTNLDNNELNIGQWKVRADDKTMDFIFPQDTIISPKQKIIFDWDLFIKKPKDFDYQQKAFNLFFPNGDIIVPVKL